MQIRPSLSASTLVAAMTLTASRARAVDSNDARLAQALFEEARQLMAQKHFSEACPKLEESQRRDPGGGTLLNLALCHEGEGKIATAYVEYTEALAGANRDARRDRQDFARTHIAAIEPRVPRLTVIVRPEGRPEGLEVTFDGAAFPQAAWGVPTPVDPGAHTVIATAPGRTRWMATVSILAGERKSVEVPIFATAVPAGPPLTPLPAPSVTTEPTAPPMTTTPAPLDTTKLTPTTRTNPLYYGTLAFTGTAALTTVVFGILAVGAKSDANDGCVPERSYCRDAASKDAASHAGTFAWVSTGALIATAVSAGLLLFIPSRLATTSRVGVAVAGGGGALELGGRF